MSRSEYERANRAAISLVKRARRRGETLTMDEARALIAEGVETIRPYRRDGKVAERARQRAQRHYWADPERGRERARRQWQRKRQAAQSDHQSPAQG